MVTDILEKLRQMLLDMQHSGRLSHIEPRLYENARAYIEKLKEDYYSLENPLENREGGLIIEAIGSVNDTVQEIFSIRTRQILDLAFQQIEGEYVDKEETRKMLPEERTMFKRIVEAIEECREALIMGEAKLFAGEGVTDEVSCEEMEQPPAVPSPPTPRTPGLTAYALVHVRSDVESFMGLDGRTYVLEEGDIITLPEKNAELLCEHNIGLNIRLNK
ncbi:MAG TPA: DNA replication complex GINS family protein [Methanoculleus sp.]|nr:DNA replication complex GINS family protein [Methanoculleus sp.]